MNSELQAKVRRQAAAYHVERLQLWFTDHIGELEMVEIPAQRLDELLQSGALPNDSSTSGFGASAGADIIAVPELVDLSDHAARLPAGHPRHRLL